MVTPVSSEGGATLERAADRLEGADKVDVPIDNPWRRDVERTHDETGEYGYPKAGCGLRGLARFTYRNPPGGLNEPVPKKNPEDDSPSPLPTWQRWKMANRRREADHRGR